MLTLRLEDTPAADVAVAGEALPFLWPALLGSGSRVTADQSVTEFEHCRFELAATLLAAHSVD